ncbi:MAG: CapA family protein [Erysipelotrichaceae bacterium]
MKRIGILLLALLLSGCAIAQEKPNEIPPVEEKPKPEEPKEEIIERASFIGVGDNLIHSAIYADPTYKMHFDPIYEHTNALTQGADLAFLNQETILGGSQIGLSHYPAFNSPWEIGTAVVNAGFDWINHATNHTLDRGLQAIDNSITFWNQYPEIKVTGIHATPEKSEELTIIERNGIRFGLLGYTYGLNGFVLPQGSEYKIDLIDREKMASDVARLKPEVDFVLVSLHFGNEYQTQANAEQKDLAHYLNGLGVDVIVGHHPHVIQPIEVIGEEQKTVVAYSLGNFLSAQDRPERMLGGALQMEFVVNRTTGEKSIENVGMIPTFTHYEFSGGWYRNFKTYLLKDYTEEQMQRHALKGQFPQMSVAGIKALAQEIMGTQYLVLE